ncbi:hypothetical protein [Rivularia sp. UHCC 0363]|nr:hypothetical protein [Rivularia sp. UHCC 0363]MEA5595619.1 hypothetical protein [Rivularia sp. UHCC 0363]
MLKKVTIIDISLGQLPLGCDLQLRSRISNSQIFFSSSSRLGIIFKL